MRADEPQSSSEKNTLDEANQALRGRRFEDAIRLCERVSDAQEITTCALIRAHALEALGRPFEAYEALRAIDSMSGKHAEQGRVERRIFEDALLARLARVTATCAVEGASVSVDGKLVGTCPLAEPIVHNPGDFILEARKDGVVVARRQVHADAGETITVQLDSVAPTAPQPPGPAKRPEVTPAPPTDSLQASETPEQTSRSGYRCSDTYKTVLLTVGVLFAIGVTVGIAFAASAEPPARRGDIAPGQVKVPLVSW